MSFGMPLPLELDIVFLGSLKLDFEPQIARRLMSVKKMADMDVQGPFKGGAFWGPQSRLAVKRLKKGGYFITGYRLRGRSAAGVRRTRCSVELNLSLSRCFVWRSVTDLGERTA